MLAVRMVESFDVEPALGHLAEEVPRLLEKIP
jgi:hypothetical protein